MPCCCHISFVILSKERHKKSKFQEEKVMTKEKLSFEQFLETVDINHQSFIRGLHNYLTKNYCKPTIEEKKSGMFVSYKHTKSKKVIVNFLFRKDGMHIRIYGENASKYIDFLNTLPQEMVNSIDKAGECGRLVKNTCSTKCSGYDVTIGGVRFQKCRYGGFEFLLTDESCPFIKSFIENEVEERAEV